MDGVIFGLYEAKTDEEIARLTTDEKGCAEVYVMNGSYYLKELATWEGFSVSSEIIYIEDLTIGEIFNIRLTNDYTSLLVKKKSTTGELLAGMEFQIFTQDSDIPIPLFFDIECINSPRHLSGATPLFAKRGVGGEFILMNSCCTS